MVLCFFHIATVLSCFNLRTIEATDKRGVYYGLFYKTIVGLKKILILYKIENNTKDISFCTCSDKRAEGIAQ